MACDLDKRRVDEHIINGAPDEHSSEALAKQARKTRKHSLDIDES